MLKLNRLFNSYFCRQSNRRALTFCFVKLSSYNRNSSAFEIIESSNKFVDHQANFDIKNKGEADLFQEELQLGENNIIQISLIQGKSGKRTISFARMFKTENSEWKYLRLPNLLMPTDAYKFVRALDRIIIACNGEKVFDEFNLNKKLAFEEIITDFYDISLILFRNEKGQLGFKLIKKLKSENKINSIFIPINSLLWIRKIFVKILEEFDGSEKLKELSVDLKNFESNEFIEQIDVVNPKGGITLASDELKLGENNKIKIELREGVSGNRTIQIMNIYRLQDDVNNKWRYLYLPKLLLPDAFNFVKALDKIIIACDGERVFDLSNTNKKLAFEEINANIYDISLNLFRNERGFLVFQILQRKKTENGKPLKKERLTSQSLQINSLLWIREIIAKMIEEFDGSKTLLKLPVIKFPFIVYQESCFD
ncbi:unnamed protein product [Meloidogyne enterolobii]|uniref:Uncharacterized protein n=1 Tax=Meloidogyne enterolobii TaxID=390850 RepID=A0ACB0YSQ7_MELEN